MLDVLEHLTDPVLLLQRVAPVLDDGGWGVISLPNVAHASVRLALLEGRFTYTDVGLLDRTHLRFFDRTGVAQLFRNAGWQSIDMARVLHRAGGTEIAVDGADPELVQQLESDIEGLTYQFVMTAVPDDSPGASLSARPACGCSLRGSSGGVGGTYGPSTIPGFSPIGTGDGA